jgi:hypothetical protein
MTAKGIVRGNVVVLEKGVALPEGTPVEVHVLNDPERRVPSQAERDAALKDLVAMSLPVAGWEQMEQEIIRGATECLP